MRPPLVTPSTGRHVDLDVAVPAVATAPAEDRRERTRAIAPAIREPEHTSSGLSKLELRHLSLQRLNFVLRDHVLDGLNLSSKVGVRSGIPHRAIVVSLHDQLFSLTATGILIGEGIRLTHTKIGNVTSRFVVQALHCRKTVVEGLVCSRNSLSSTGVNSRQNVTSLRLQILVIKTALDLIRGCEILITDSIGEAVVTPAITEAATSQNQQGEDPHESTAITESPTIVSAVQQCNISRTKRTIVHCYCLPLYLSPAYLRTIGS